MRGDVGISSCLLSGGGAGPDLLTTTQLVEGVPRDQMSYTVPAPHYHTPVISDHLQISSSSDV